MLRDTLGTGYF